MRNITTCGRWCSYCSYPPQKLCNNDKCKHCLENSFASHPKSKYWSKENDISPRNVFKSSGKKYKFDCICNHTFEKSLSDIAKNGWCPYCANPPIKLCDDDNCITCYNKSFASCSKAKYWSKENKLTTRQVFKSSNNKYKFDCECGHKFQIIPSSIIFYNRWCSYCCYPPQKLCNNKSCNQCFGNSFASHPLSLYWSCKNKLNPREVFKSSNKRYKFDCPLCNDIYIYQLQQI